MRCYNSYDPKNNFYTDLTVDNIANRQWMWLLCNEPLNFWQALVLSAPNCRISSKLLKVEHLDHETQSFLDL